MGKYIAPDLEILKCVIEDVILASLEGDVPIDENTTPTLGDDTPDLGEDF